MKIVRFEIRAFTRLPRPSNRCIGGDGPYKQAQGLLLQPLQTTRHSGSRNRTPFYDVPTECQGLSLSSYAALEFWVKGISG